MDIVRAKPGIGRQAPRTRVFFSGAADLALEKGCSRAQNIPHEQQSSKNQRKWCRQQQEVVAGDTYLCANHPRAGTAKGKATAKMMAVMDKRVVMGMTQCLQPLKIHT